MKHSIKLHMLLGLAALLVFSIVGCATKTEEIVIDETVQGAQSVSSGESRPAESEQPAEPQAGVEAPRIQESVKAEEPAGEAPPLQAPSAKKAVFPLLRSFDLLGREARIEAYADHADVSYPEFVTEADIAAAAKAALAAYPKRLEGVFYQTTGPGKAVVSYPAGLDEADIDYGLGVLEADLKWYIDNLPAPSAKAPAEEAEAPAPDVAPAKAAGEAASVEGSAEAPAEAAPAKAPAEATSSGIPVEAPDESGPKETAGADEKGGLPVVVLPTGTSGPDGPSKVEGEAARAKAQGKDAPASAAERSAVADKPGEGPAVAPRDEKAAKPATGGVVARIPVRLDGEEIHLRTKQTNLGSLICSAMTQKSGADFAVINGGSIKSSLAKGDLVAEDVEAVLAPDTQLVVIELTGARLYELFGHSQKIWPKPFEGYLQTDLQIVSIPQEGGGRRILKIFFEGKPIDKNKVYRCATSDFLMGGGAGYSGFSLPDFGNFKLLGELAPILVQWLGETYPPEVGSGF